MRILAIDPGSEQSAYVVWDKINRRIYSKNIAKNPEIIAWIPVWPYDQIIIEMVASYGMPVGADVFWTCVAIGEFAQRHRDTRCMPGEVVYVFRKDIKLHFCNSMKAKDSNIRQALIDRFGKPGTKKEPGLLYGVKKDEWQALALAIYAQDVLLEERP